MANQKKICYVMCYKQPDYIRAHSQITALNESKNFKVTTIKNSNAGLLKYIEILQKLYRTKKNFQADYYILGFRAYEYYWIAKLVIGKKGKIVFDAMMSPYMALRKERKAGILGIAISPIIRFVEKSILKNANIILTDTVGHVRYYKKTFKINESNIVNIPVGAIEREITITPDKEGNNPINFLFYGSFLPLHGIEYLISAIKLCKPDIGIFTFVGDPGKYLKPLSELSKTHKIILKSRMTFSQLIENELPLATVGLGGPFGNTFQGNLVVTGKSSQFLSFKIATIIGKADTGYSLSDKTNCLLVNQGDPEEIAETLNWCKENRKELIKIGENGYRLYCNELSTESIKNRLEAILT